MACVDAVQSFLRAWQQLGRATGSSVPTPRDADLQLPSAACPNEELINGRLHELSALAFNDGVNQAFPVKDSRPHTYPTPELLERILGLKSNDTTLLRGILKPSK